MWRRGGSLLKKMRWMYRIWIFRNSSRGGLPGLPLYLFRAGGVRHSWSARSLAPLEKTLGFGMTPLFSDAVFPGGGPFDAGLKACVTLSNFCSQQLPLTV